MWECNPQLFHIIEVPLFPKETCTLVTCDHLHPKTSYGINDNPYVDYQEISIYLNF